MENKNTSSLYTIAKDIQQQNIQDYLAYCAGHGTEDSTRENGKVGE